MRVSDIDIDRIYISSAVRSTNYHMIENHSHHYFELYYVRHGRCLMYIDSSLYQMKSGDVIIIPPMVNHFTRYTSKCTRINLYFKESELVDSTGEMFRPGIVEHAEDSSTINVIHMPQAYVERMNGIMDNMLSDEKVDDEDTAMIQRLSLRLILVYIKRYGIKTTASNPLQSDEEIMKAVRYINENYAQPITLESLAEVAGLSSTYFSKKFRAVTGNGMKEYLNYIRLNNAAMELKSTNLSITDIALNCGFNNSNYFKDSFKKMYGMSPRGYRKSREDDGIKEKAEMEKVNLGDKIVLS